MKNNYKKKALLITTITITIMLFFSSAISTAVILNIPPKTDEKQDCHLCSEEKTLSITDGGACGPKCVERARSFLGNSKIVAWAIGIVTLALQYAKYSTLVVISFIIANIIIPAFRAYTFLKWSVALIVAIIVDACIIHCTICI